ncbi:MAG: ABC transporter permease [Treponema sp.]|nr:ABC transporter permease [Treponema sp.]
MSLLYALHGAVALGILWSVMTLGVYITFRILDIADLTVDGSFATGGAMSGMLIVNGVNPFVSLLAAFAVGMLAGLVTGLMHTKIKIHVLLASILTMIALYSVNIRIMGKANTPLLGVRTVTSFWMEHFELTTTTASLIVGVIFVTLLIVLMYWFFGTELGSAMRATGNNEHMMRALGVNTDTMKIFGLMLANGFVSLSGGLVAQSQGYADVGMGTGTIVIGLASIIIGEVIFGRHFGFWYTFLSVVLGSILYRMVIAVVLQLGLKSTDLKLFTALIVAVALSVPVVKERVASRRRSPFPGASHLDKEIRRNPELTDTVGG